MALVMDAAVLAPLSGSRKRPAGLTASEC